MSITQVKQTKCLGVIIDEELTWPLIFNTNAQKFHGEIGP